MLRLPFFFLSPPGKRGRLTILTFHRVLAQADPLVPDLPAAQEFEAHMRWLRSWFCVLPLSQAVRMLGTSELPARALSITFDDGYSDNLLIAAPILARLGMAATFFVATGYMDGGCMWNDRLTAVLRACPGPVLDLTDLGLKRYDVSTPSRRQRSIVDLLRDAKYFEASARQSLVDQVVGRFGTDAAPDLMMRPQQVAELRRMGMEIGAHTVTHPILTRVDAAQARQEITSSKARLEGLLDETVSLFAYPNGMPDRDYAAEHARMAREAGFSAAVTTAAGAARADSDRWQLPRFSPWDHDRLRYAMRLMRNFKADGRKAA